MTDSPHAEWIREHIELYERDPEKAHMWDASHLGGPGPLPTLLLTTRGRVSGQDRVVPLVYKKEDTSYVIVASKGGQPKHPFWYLNLESDPRCRLQVATRKFEARARVAEGDERSHLWSRMVDLHADYADYQERAKERQIPVVVLDPVVAKGQAVPSEAN